MNVHSRRHWLRMSALTPFLACGVVLLAPLAVQAAEADDVGAIRQVLMRTFDRPEARLRVDPVVVHKQHAVAAWQQDDRGGRALMRRTDDGKAWEITLCAGDGLRQADTLAATGMSAADASALAQAVVKAESTLDAKTRARLASFQGMVRMGPNGEHPPMADHGSHGGHGQHGAHDMPGHGKKDHAQPHKGH